MNIESIVLLKMTAAFGLRSKALRTLMWVLF